MSNRKQRILYAALCTTAVMTACGVSARAEVVLLGNEPQGWVFTTDGFLNAFAIDSTSSAGPQDAKHIYPAYAIGPAGLSSISGNNGGNAFHVTNGLMPESFGFNVRSPDIDGSKLAFRLSLQSGMTNNSGHVWDSDGASGGSSSLLREAYVNYSGTWGELLAGKALGTFGSQAILNDMYLFGVGAGVNSGGASTAQNASNTTVGGIGYGYMYAGWDGTIRYTSPVFLGGFKAVVDVQQPSEARSDETVAGVSTAVANTTTAPRVEGGINYAGKIGATSVTSWLNGTWQQAKLAGSATDKTVTIGGGELGGKLAYGPMDVVAHGYMGPGLGLSGAQLSFDSIDATGHAPEGYGYYVQAQYHFDEGTSLGTRYGSSYISQTNYMKNEQTNGTYYHMTEKDLLGAQVTQVINKYFRVVGEYDHVTNTWGDRTSQHEEIGSIGVVATY